MSERVARWWHVGGGERDRGSKQPLMGGHSKSDRVPVDLDKVISGNLGVLSQTFYGIPLCPLIAFLRSSYYESDVGLHSSDGPRGKMPSLV